MDKTVNILQIIFCIIIIIFSLFIFKNFDFKNKLTKSFTRGDYIEFYDKDNEIIFSCYNNFRVYDNDNYIKIISDNNYFFLVPFGYYRIYYFEDINNDL